MDAKDINKRECMMNRTFHPNLEWTLPVPRINKGNVKKYDWPTAHARASFALSLTGKASLQPMPGKFYSMREVRVDNPDGGGTIAAIQIRWRHVRNNAAANNFNAMEKDAFGDSHFSVLPPQTEYI